MGDDTGAPVRICDGVTNTSNCIEPNDMKNPRTRPNAVSLANGDDTGVPVKICNGSNTHDCVEPE
jgi:hypothetical protein